MSREKGALGSFVASSSARALRAVGRAGSLLITARLFPIAEVGEFAFAFGIGTLTAGVLDLGITSYLQREVGASGFQSRHVERTALRVRLLSLPAALILGFAILVLINPEIDSSAIGTLIFAVTLSLSDFLAGIQRANGRYERESLELGPVLVSGLGAGLISVALGGGFPAFQWALGLGALTVGGTRSAVLYRKLRSREPAADMPHANTSLLISGSFWFWALNIGVLALFELPVVLLRWLADGESVALYAAAMRSVGLASQPLVVLGAVFVPSMAYQARTHRGRFLGTVRRLNCLLLLAIPPGVLLSIGGGNLLLQIFGSAYTEASGLLWILTFGVLIGIGAPYAGSLLVDGFEKELATNAIVSGVVGTVTCILMIPVYGALGAGLGICCGLAVSKVGHVILYSFKPLPWGSSLEWIAAVALTIWGGLLIGSPASTRWIILIAGALVCGMLMVRSLWMMSLFDTEDSLENHRGPTGDVDSTSLLAEGTLRLTVKTRLKILSLRHAPWLYWSWRRLRHGHERFEPETGLLKHLCEPGSIAMDVGANYGVYAHNLLAYAEVVHAFEPLPELADLLESAFRGIGSRVIVHRLALSDRDGSVVLRSPIGMPGRSTIELSNLLESDILPGTPIRTCTVARRRADTLDLGQVGFIKIDVEGHELEVLIGAQEILEHYRPSLLIEIEERHRSGSVNAVTDYLEDFGYSGFFLLTSKLHPITGFESKRHQNASRPRDYVRNFIFVHPMRQDALRGLL